MTPYVPQMFSHAVAKALTRVAALICLFCPGLAHGLELQLPANAVLQNEYIEPASSYRFAIGPWTDGGVPFVATEGEVTRQIWRIEASGLTTLQLLSPLREQLLAEGFALLFQCRTQVCGGFDFRFAIDITPPPEMQIDLGDYRYLSMQRDDANGTENVEIIASRTSRAGFVQVTRSGPPQTDAPAIGTANGAPTVAQSLPAPPQAQAQQPAITLATDLENIGRSILSDLTFASGSSQLEPADYASLQQLADYLAAWPQRTVALVGHTDSAGDLKTNIELGRRRAESVLNRLVDDYGVNSAQLEAAGMGYLAPIASNLTPEGREANRRVEVILTSTE